MKRRPAIPAEVFLVFRDKGDLMSVTLFMYVW